VYQILDNTPYEKTFSKLLIGKFYLSKPEFEKDDDEGLSRQCPWIMDLGSGERGALDEFDGLSDKQGDLTSILIPS
jgi:hypothetical protein